MSPSSDCGQGCAAFQKECLMKSATILTIGVIFCVATAAGGREAGIRPQVPVIIEHTWAHSPEWGYEPMPPCANGVVHNLDPKGDGFLAVKAGPGLHYERIDKLFNGKQAHHVRPKRRVARNRLHQNPPGVCHVALL
jgi:hypothetical protein